MSVTDLPIFLQGNGAPVSEERTITDLTVTGTLPPELDGRYIRAGANPVNGIADHPFTGDGMVHGIRLRDGQAEWYRNRYVQTPYLLDPSLDINDPAVMSDRKNSKANTSIIGHSGRIMALSELHFPYALDGELATIGPVDFGGKLTTSFTAHPKICPVTGEIIAFGYDIFEPYCTYLRVSADGELVQSESISVNGPTMMHDFNVTENYVVFMDLPAVFSLERAMNGEPPVQWDPSYPARLGVMPRTGTDSDVVWYDIDPCYVFHPMNAYEDGDQLVLDVARLDHVWRNGDPADFPDPTLHRWTIDRTAGKVLEAQLDDRPAEFPRVADAVVGQQHRYGYMMANLGEATLTNPGAVSGAIIKYDLVSGEQKVHELGRGQIPGEAVFAPGASGRGEDDGYLMTFVYDADRHASKFIVLDAQTMDPEPVATVDLPRIPFGFHGAWVPSSVVD